MMEWITWKGLAVRGVGLLSVALLATLFLRSLWLRHGDQTFALAFTLFLLGVLWAMATVFVGAIDEVVNIVPCWDLRLLTLRHVEIIWGPSIVASLWLLWVVARRRP